MRKALGEIPKKLAASRVDNQTVFLLKFSKNEPSDSEGLIASSFIYSPGFFNEIKYSNLLNFRLNLSLIKSYQWNFL